MIDDPFYVSFRIAGNVRRMATPDHERWSLDDLKDGFWVTRDFTPCREMQGQFWIPPSQIVLIEKRNQPPTPL